MGDWRTLVRYGLAAFTVVFGAVVYRAIESRQPPIAVADAERSDPTALIESTGAVVTQAKGASRDFRIEAARQLTYADGASRLEEVHISVSERAGRSFDVTSRSADVGANRGTIDLQGDVEILDDTGLTATTERALFREADGMLRIPESIQFAQGRLEGSGVGATYDRNRDVLRLLDHAVITMAPDTAGLGLTEITSGLAEIARADGYMRFEHDVMIVRDAQVIEAQAVHAYFAGPDQRIELVQLRGGSSVMPRDGHGGSLQAMQARDMDLYYAEQGQTLQSATLLGGASITIPPGPAGARRRVAAHRLVVGLGQDGVTVESLEGRGDVRLEFDATAATPSRRIRAPRLDGNGVPGSGLSNVVMTGGVEQRERDADTTDRVVSARTLTLAVAPGLGDVQQATFVDDVRFEEDDLSGTSGLARYDVAADSLVLAIPAAETSTAGADAEPAAADPGEVAGSTTTATAASTPTARPVVTDDRAVIEANTITVSSAGGRLLAETDVQTVMRASRGEEEQDGARRSAMLRADEPVYVTGARLEYERTDGQAVYSGGARLWQGETTIQGNTITIDDRSGDLAADGATRSAMMLTKRDAAAAEAGARPGGQAASDTQAEAGQDPGAVVVSSVATAELLRYDEANRRTTYVGKPPETPAGPVPEPAGTAAPAKPAAPAWTQAHVTGPQGDLRAHKIELYLAEDGSTLERVEAYGEVRLRTDFVPRPEQEVEATAAEPPPREVRDAEGERLTYFAADERYLMHGVPVVITERCRETRGKSLTFFKSVDTITVDGNEEIRTQSRAESECPEPPSD